MKKIILYGFIGVSSILYGYEPSVYGAGDIDSVNPYGLTKTEKTVLDNKKSLQRLFNRVKEQQRKIDGLITVIEGQNKEIVYLKEELKIVDKKIKPPEDTNKTYTILVELGQMIDKINNSYVSKDELRDILSRTKTEVVVNSIEDSTSGSYIAVNAKESYSEARQLLSSANYSVAKEKFLQALSDNYKPASSNYYLGECSYYMQEYKDAIAYYKKSASLYDKASYMPVLYLHTAISLANSGEKEQAKGFFQYIIDNYPNTKSASIAKKRI